jgi:hypothetical protein
MGILRSVVAPSTNCMAFCDPEMIGCSPIGAQVIRDQLVGDKAIFLQERTHEFHRRPLVPPALDKHVEHFALGVHGALKIDHAAIDFQIDFVQMPSRVGLGSAFAQVRRDLGSKMVHPAPDGLVGVHDNTFRQ